MIEKKFSKSGFSLVEVLVAAAIIVLFLVALVTAYNIYVRLALANNSSTKAVFLAEEGLEAAKILRDESWSTEVTPLAIGTPYHLYFDGGTWHATTTEMLIDGTFVRTITFAEVYRDANSDIAGPTETLDPNTRQVTAEVSWSYRGATTTKSMSSYLTNLFND